MEIQDFGDKLCTVLLQTLKKNMQNVALKKVNIKNCFCRKTRRACVLKMYVKQSKNTSLAIFFLLQVRNWAKTG